jgi:hypothetical protein
VVEFLGGHRVQTVARLRPVDRDFEQVPVAAHEDAPADGEHKSV